MKSRFELGGMRYKKEYEPMIELAYQHDDKKLKEMEEKLSIKSKEIAKKRKQIFTKLQKEGKNWNMDLHKITLKTGENAEKTLNVMYARDLVKMFKEKHNLR